MDGSNREPMAQSRGQIRQGQDSPAAPVVWRLTQVVLVIWFLVSLLSGGLRAGLHGAWTAARTGPIPPPGQPDARAQWAGGYYNVLDALVHEPLTRETSVAVVLTEAHWLGLTSDSGAYVFECIYRLYPTKPDFYNATAKGEPEIAWMRSPPGQIPQVPPLWEHDYVLWGVGAAAPALGYREIGRAPEAQLYRRAGEGRP